MPGLLDMLRMADPSQAERWGQHQVGLSPGLGGLLAPRPQQGAPVQQQPMPAPQMAMQPQPQPQPQQGGGLGGLLASLFNPQDRGRNATVQYLQQQGLESGMAQLVAGDKTLLRGYLAKGLTPASAKDDLMSVDGQLYNTRSNEWITPPGGRDKPTDDMREFERARQDGYKGTFTDWMTKGVRDQDKGFQQEQGLRKEYVGLPEYKRFDDVKASYERVRAAAQRDSGAGDLGLIFGFMKMLDPGSVVREGEFANAENTAGVPDRIRNLYNRVVSGERLNTGQRQEFVATAGDLYKSEFDRMRGINERYRSIAGSHGIDPTRIVIDPPDFPALTLGQAGAPAAPAPAPSATETQMPKPGDIVDGYRFKGGNPADQNSWEPVR